MSRKMVIQKDTVIFWIISILLLYMLWFQYAVAVNGLVMPVCAAILGLYIVLGNRSLQFYRELIPIFLFFLCCLVSSLLSPDASSGFGLLVSMLKYSIPMIAIYVYVGRDKEKLKKILWIISISCFLVALFCLFNGTITMTGAVTLGDLNSNVLSTYLMLGLISNLLLLTNDVFIKKKGILFVFIVIEAAAQLASASRRGILVFIFLCVTYAFVKLTIQSPTKNAIIKYIVIIFIVILGIAIFADEILVKVESAAFFQRFLGTAATVGGDRMRMYYQQVARELFTSSPLIGNGLGAVARHAGVYSHSMYYETLACTGLAGMLCIIFFFGRLVRNCNMMKKVN